MITQSHILLSEPLFGDLIYIKAFHLSPQELKQKLHGMIGMVTNATAK